MPHRGRRSRRRPHTPRRGAHPTPAARDLLTAEDSNPPLVHAAEASLIQEWCDARQRGDVARAEELVTFLAGANRSLVARATRRYRTARLDRQDLDQAASLGVLTALQRFDASLGVPLAAYAALWMRKEIQRALAAGEFGIAVPSHRSGDLAAVRTAATRAHALDDSDLAEQLRVTPNTVAGLRRAIYTDALDTSKLDYGRPVESTSAVEQVVEAPLMRGLLAKELRRLPPLQQSIIVLRYGLDGSRERSAREVGRLIGASDFTIRTQLSRGLATLQRRLSSLQESDAPDLA